MKPETETSETRCLARYGETRCGETKAVSHPVPLCEEHALEVAIAVVPKLLSTALSETRARLEDGTRPLAPDLAHVVSSAQPASWPDEERHSSLVYFMANGGRVKIGHTRGINSRIKALSLRRNAILLLLHGGPRLERALHEKFAGQRIEDSEWFELTPEIVRFVGSKNHTQPSRRPEPSTSTRARHGDIAAGLRRLVAADITDPGIITTHLTRDLGREVDIRTVKRLLRRERRLAT